MVRCLVPRSALDGSDSLLPEAVAHHLRTVLRVRVGDELTLLDGEGRRRAARVVDVQHRSVRCEACGTVETLPPPTPALTLYQCVAKGARMDWLVEKAVELGAATLVPVLSRHAVVKLPEGTRVERWDRIADSALEQCGGLWRTQIEPVCGWNDAVARVASLRPTFVAALAPEARPLRETLAPFVDAPPAVAAWFVGPEGDFAADELRSLLEAGALPVGLGPRVLRSETAALYGLCALACAFGR